jgi:Di- and tricarboxylate transporters
LAILIGGLGIGFGTFIGIAVLLAATLIALIPIGVALYQNWSTVKTVLSEVFDVLKTLGSAVKTVFDAIPGPVKTLAVDILAIYTASRLLVAAFAALKISSLVGNLLVLGRTFTLVATGEIAATEATIGLVAALGGWEVLAVAAAIAGIVIAVKLLGSSSYDVKAHVDALRDTLDKLGTSGRKFADAASSLETTNQAIKDTKHSLQGLNQGSYAYKSTLDTLHGLEQQRAADLAASAAAMKQVTTQQAEANSQLADLTSHKAFQFDLRGTQARLRAAQQAQLVTPSALNERRVQGIQDEINAWRDDESVIGKTITTYQNLLAQGINPASAGMKTMRGNIKDAMDQLTVSDPAKALQFFQRMTPIVLKFTEAMKIAPNPAQQQYLNSIPKNMTAAMELYTKLTGKILQRPLADIIFNHPQAGRSIAAFLATTKDKVGSAKFKADLSQIFKIPPGADKELARKIQHSMPKNLKAVIKMVIDDTQAKRDSKKVLVQAREQNQKVINLQRLAAGRLGGATGQKSLPVTGALDTALQKARKLNRQAVNIKSKTTPKDPWKPFENTTKAMSAIQGVVATMATAGAEAGQGWASSFNTAAAGYLAAHPLDQVVRKHQVSGSPAKKFIPVGKEAMQGWALGFVKEAEGGKTKADIKSAMTTIAQAMMDAWTSLHDTMTSNFGELFSGDVIQQKLDWGEKLNIKDLTKDLATQKKAFDTFRKDLNKLGGRGAPTGLLQQLQEMGPAANAEMEALLSGTKKQQRRYFRLWNQSHRDIGKATKDAFDRQRAEWTKHGRSMAVGILLGLRSEEPALMRYFQHLARALVSKFKHHNKSHSPSQLYFAEGVNIMRGLQLGIESMNVKLPPVGGLEHRGRGKEACAVTNNYNTTYNVHAGKNESLVSALRKHEFLVRSHR